LFGGETRLSHEPTEMSVLARYLNTEKYQGEMRELVNCQLLNEKTQCGLFLKDTALARIGWSGDVKDFPKAEEYCHTYQNGDKNDGIFFKTPRMVVIHCGFAKNLTFIENSDKGGIEGIYPRDSYLYDDWAEQNPDKPSPYKRRRLVLIFLVNADGAAVHKKPLILSIHGGASKMFCEAYGTFIEQLESAFADRMGLKSAAGFDPKQAAAAIFTPTFGSQLYGGDKARSWVAYPEKWVVPTAEKIEDFFPKTDEDIDFVESVWETCTPEVYAKSFFDQCSKAIGYHAIKPGMDWSLPPVEGGNGTKALFGARDEATGEITLD
jgi:Family of unknown function (DUF5895)